MTEAIGCKEMAAMLRGAAEQVRANHELLGRLDSVGGDGDHGTTMLRAMAHLEKAVDGASGKDLKSLLYDVGWAILGVDGGATGPLLGMFFIGMSEAAEGRDTLDASGLATAFEAGLAGVRAQTKAQPGDKTMIDALVPAVMAAGCAAESGEDLLSVLRDAAAAAAAGAAASKDMQARFGRAKNIKELSIGTPDAGATSVSLIFAGFLKGVEADG